MDAVDEAIGKLLADRRRLWAELEEQARLLGMSAERECDLRGELERERALADRLAEAILSFCSSGMVWPNTDTPEKAVTAWKEARSE